MTCATCTHYYEPREFDGACMHPRSLLRLDVQPKVCPDYTADPVKIEAAHQAAARAARPIGRAPERWISEQTEMRLQPKYRDYHQGAER